MEKTITIYGAGYVGLVTSVCFAELGNHVLLVDINAQKIAELQQGISPIYEPDLEEYLQRHINTTGRIAFSTDLKAGVDHGLFQFIAVGTPSAEDGSADLQSVFAVATGIAECATEYRIIVNKSTVTIGTAQKIKRLMLEKLQQRGAHTDFDVVSNPEFLRQGAAIYDFMQPDRIIIGADNDRAAKLLHELYQPLDDNSQRFIFMDNNSAELTKYVANAYLAARISFINEMSHLAERFGADIDMIRRGVGSDHRIGHQFLYAGCGFGGSCFPKDVRALKKMSEELGYSPAILKAVESVNNQQKRVLFNKISTYFQGNVAGKTIAIWGLAFKPNTDDMREASSLVLIDALLAAGAKVQAYDPAASSLAQRIYAQAQGFNLCTKANDTLAGADVLAVVTEWDEFRHPDFDLIKRKLRYPAVFDGRNLYATQVLAEHGLSYFAIGRGEKLSHSLSASLVEESIF
ncbi:MAG TPA: UDP-glucose/GDP-mannose dehydrogenase family protein [Gammaproteobacteria bacterium]|nr:UDP-glucose/GDP-mannose dehydrogenase family protein [Gammaproteobacteria bacterium]